MDYREKTPRKNKIQSESTKSKKQHSSLGRWDRRVDENLKLNHIDPFRGTDSFVTYSCGDNLSATTKHSSLTCENIQQETDSKKTPNWRPNTLKDYNKCGDRFIPNRTSTNVELAHYQIFNQNDQDDDVFDSPKTQTSRKFLAENLHGNLEDQKVIGYKQKMPNNMLNTEFVKVKASSVVKKVCLRHISPTPEKILDAPEITDDYYLNLMDWSSQNVLAICLGRTVYMWDANCGQITSQTDLASEDDQTTSVSWVESGNLLAIGTSTNDIHLYDMDNGKSVRTFTTHVAKVGALSWNEHILTSASKAGVIQHHDVRAQKHLVGKFQAHPQEVCGIKWSPDGKYLATGGNDDTIRIYPNHSGMHYTRNVPLYEFTEHKSAIKALAWCPWQPYMLASGGGQNDKQIAFWNCNVGKLSNKIKTNSQVTCLLWSDEYHELASSHGYDRYQISLWKYPCMNQITELTGHDARIIDMAMSPDGTMVMTAGADETLRLWNCFAKDPALKRKEARKKESSSTTCLNLNNIR